MRVTAHQEIEGVQAGQDVTVDAERGAWLIANGYASLASDQSDDDAEAHLAHSASKADWVAYAEAHGLEDADQFTKAQLIERFG